MKLFKREKYLSVIRPFYDTEDIIKVVTGVRRCGKSSLMQTIAEELQDWGVPEQDIVYLDLDQRGYRKIKDADALEQMIVNKSSAGGEKKYLFIDEVQNVKGFEEVVNGFRNDGGYSIFITGSNSYLLSGELSTKLTGRYLEFELFTLTFDEYIGMKKLYGIPVSANSQEELNQYVLEGGFPRAVTLEGMDAKRQYVRSVVNEIFEKDIRTRVKIRKPETFRIVRDYIINNFGATTSIKRICDGLNHNGLSITRATVSRYIQALADAKILYACDRFDVKSRRTLNGEKKYYLSDLGFYFSQNTDNRINYGPVLENLVYIYSRSLGYSVSVGKIGNLEVDFIIRDNAMNYSYLQVAYTIMASRETEDREYRPLESIWDNYSKYVLTEDGLLQKRNGIRHVNLGNFMMNGRKF